MLTKLSLLALVASLPTLSANALAARKIEKPEDWMAKLAERLPEGSYLGKTDRRKDCQLVIESEPSKVYRAYIVINGQKRSSFELAPTDKVGGSWETLEGSADEPVPTGHPVEKDDYLSVGSFRGTPHESRETYGYYGYTQRALLIVDKKGKRKVEIESISNGGVSKMNCNLNGQTGELPPPAAEDLSDRPNTTLISCKNDKVEIHFQRNAFTDVTALGTHDRDNNPQTNYDDDGAYYKRGGVNAIAMGQVKMVELSEGDVFHSKRISVELKDEIQGSSSKRRYFKAQYSLKVLNDYYKQPMKIPATGELKCTAANLP